MDNTNKVLGCVCEGTGIDPAFQDACKCVTQAKVEGVTPKQQAFIDSLIKQIGTKVTVKVSYETKAEASNTIDLLKAVTNLVNLLRTRVVTPEQATNIKAKLATDPDMKWVKNATAKAISLPRKGS